MKKTTILGILYLVTGIFIIYWAQTHSPDDNLVDKIGREISDSYTMSQPWYIVSLALGSAIGTLGVLRILRSFK